MLPTNDKERKALPVFRGPMMYFPDAILELARVCKIGNDQHNPGEPLHWAREKSTEQMDTAIRHMMDHGLGNETDIDGAYHLAKAAWRILAELQLTIEKRRAKTESEKQIRDQIDQLEADMSKAVLATLTSTEKVAFDDPRTAASLRALGDRALEYVVDQKAMEDQLEANMTWRSDHMRDEPRRRVDGDGVNAHGMVEAAPGCCAVRDCAVCKRVAELDGAARDQGMKL